MFIDRRRLMEMAAGAAAGAAAPIASAMGIGGRQTALQAHATAMLRAIHEARDQGQAGLSPYFILDIGAIFVQALAQSGRATIQVEAVSEKSLPAVGVILTPAKLHLLAELGFNPPGDWSPNHWRHIEIEGPSDLDRAGKLMAAVVTDVFGIRDPIPMDAISVGDLAFVEPHEPAQG